MFGLNAVALVFFGCINASAYNLCKINKQKRRAVVLILSAILLTLNLFRYCVYYPIIKGVMMLPVEFSTVAYFAVPAILLVSKKRLHSWAAYSGLMAGFIYYMAMITAGGMIYETYPPLDIYISMFYHGTVYFCGFVTIGSEVLSAKDAPKLLLGVGLVALRAVLLRPFVTGSDGLLIYILLDGAAVRRLLPQSTWSVTLPVYYILISGFVLLTVRGFFSKTAGNTANFPPCEHRRYLWQNIFKGHLSARCPLVLSGFYAKIPDIRFSAHRHRPRVRRLCISALFLPQALSLCLCGFV